MMMKFSLRILMASVSAMVSGLVAIIVSMILRGYLGMGTEWTAFRLKLGDGTYALSWLWVLGGIMFVVGLVFTILQFSALKKRGEVFA